ncbi:Coenzyme F420 hydrogenase/dehydrogenase, beta subunit C-terminal domain [Celeribacter neptunius]|uniref:Coenzyme F420 hydrogenase subunit beta n=1 Tax=Celeribacter neptunius TaxID=588602 RepID=A0A1I3SDP3_9RHOB|nr:Coenzyme F420 hydrogenase/dehydrogenase, beta subunit C-terminal domain [Celeribacter neptunius]SFJ56845.1 coenzyme F420 hydrogenase subunit beta [Celeribacter neptunius]
MSLQADLKRITDTRFCLSCGACSYICSPDKVAMVDIDHVGLRPQFSDGIAPALIREACAVCPTITSDYGQLKDRDDYVASVDKKTETNWGAITGIWEGYANDEELRFKGSSGGALTAIAQYCLEQLDYHAALHTGEDPDDPIRNKTRLSHTRDELLAAVGSRYSPASVCDGLGGVEAAPKPCVVIGKPVEIAATRNAMALRPALAEKVGVTLSFFCAETPPTKATRRLMAEHGVPEEGLETLRYRGYGWPGYFTTRNAGEAPRQHWIYQRAWAYLQGFRPWSAHLWPDGAGELADISCGDPWYEEPDGENPGFSLIVARTKLGKEIIEGAIAKGYLTATPAETWKLDKSQEGLLRKKGSVWGRRLAHRVMGMPNTRFKGLDLFTPWMALSPKEKLASTVGTLRRILKRGLWKRA